MGWVLILFAHVGVMGQGNSNALATAQFQSEKACIAAGEQAKAMARGTVKEIAFVCASTSK
jgi:hypothetical protein